MSFSPPYVIDNLYCVTDLSITQYGKLPVETPAASGSPLYFDAPFCKLFFEPMFLFTDTPLFVQGRAAVFERGF